MPNLPLYPNAKPTDGDILILCEGDAVGYESEFLKMWADSTDLSGRFVKVMACGTGDALYGVADAIGRTVPLIVIEDRDFRTTDEAARDCKKKLRNREGRNVAMRGWLAWGRAEVENYFTDDDVLTPVFADAFLCTVDEVRDAARSALSHLAVAQSLEYALYRARKSWLSTDASRALRVASLQWERTGQVPLPSTVVRENIEGRLKKWQLSLHDGNTWEDPMAGEQLLADFDAKCRDWSGLAYESPTWRHDWGCKEVLKHVRMKLSEKKAGWWSLPAMKHQGVDWAAMPDDKTRDAHDRSLERTMQPKLVAAVAARINLDPGFDLVAEMNELAKLIRSA